MLPIRCAARAAAARVSVGRRAAHETPSSASSLDAGEWKSLFLKAGRERQQVGPSPVDTVGLLNEDDVRHLSVGERCAFLLRNASVMVQSTSDKAGKSALDLIASPTTWQQGTSRPALDNDITSDTLLERAQVQQRNLYFALTSRKRLLVRALRTMCTCDGCSSGRVTIVSSP